MKNYIAQTEEGKFVERFFGSSMLVTENKKAARVYTKSVLVKRMEKFDLKLTLIEI